MPNQQYNKLNDTTQQVDYVIDIMKDNMEKVLQRDEKLTDIEDKTDELQDSSSRFEKISKKLKYKLLCKNMRTFLILLGIFLILLVITILIITNK